MKKKHIIYSIFLLSTLILSGCSTKCELSQPGPQGEKGETGERGPAGSDGQDGVSVVSITKTSSDGLVDTYTITYSDGTTSTFTVTNGANGEQGIQGNPGNNGHTPEITIGGNGNWFVDGVDTGIKAQGPQGNPGEPGSDGTSVLTGHGEPTSNLGKIGDSYIDLETWNYYVKEQSGWVLNGNIKGAQGNPGSTGSAGNDGVSVETITKTDSEGLVDTYTITYSDGSTSTFTITNGANGEQGIQGNPGTDGHTPVITIGTNGNWYVDGVDTGIAAQGPQGDTGPTGISVVSSYIDENGDLIVEFSDGTSQNAGHIKDTDIYTVRFHVDDEVVATRNVISGSKVSRPTLEETAGYTISDWYYDDNGTHESWKFFGYVITEDTDLYAEYTCNDYTISFVDEQFGHTVSDLAATYDQPYSLEQISQIGYTFSGWKDSDDVLWNNTGDYRVASNITLYAVWDANTYTVTLDANGGTTSPSSLTATYDLTYNLPIPTKAHYYFLGWFDGTTKVSNNATWKYTENKTFVAQWTNESNTYVLDAGDGECSIDSIVINYEEEYELPTPTRDGYSFLGWFYGYNQIPLRGTWKYENTDGTLGGVIVASWYKGVISNPSFEYDYKSGGYKLLWCHPKDGVLDIPSEVNGKKLKFVRSGAIEDADTIIDISIPFTGYSNDESYAYTHHFYYIFGYTVKNNPTAPDGYVFLGSRYDNTTYKTSYYFVKRNTSIKTVTITGKDVNSIYKEAFYFCSSLTSITISNSVTSIGRSAFNMCESLTSIYIPNSVTSIGAGAFRYCSSLTSIVIPNSVISIDDSAFLYCSSLTSIVIPNSVTSIGAGAFKKCSSLTSIVIPNSVASIGNLAFEDCTSLATIYCYASSKPSNWSSYWNSKCNATVIWGYTDSNDV